MSDSVTPWTVVCQAPLSLGFSRQENWSELPFPFPGALSDPGIEPRSPAFQADSLQTELWGKPCSEDTRWKLNWKIGSDGPKMGPMELRFLFFFFRWYSWWDRVSLCQCMTEVGQRKILCFVCTQVSGQGGRWVDRTPMMSSKASRGLVGDLEVQRPHLHWPVWSGLLWGGDIRDWHYVAPLDGPYFKKVEEQSWRAWRGRKTSTSLTSLVGMGYSCEDHVYLQLSAS